MYEETTIILYKITLVQNEYECKNNNNNNNSILMRIASGLKLFFFFGLTDIVEIYKKTAKNRIKNIKYVIFFLPRSSLVSFAGPSAGPLGA